MGRWRRTIIKIILLSLCSSYGLTLSTSYVKETKSQFLVNLMSGCNSAHASQDANEPDIEWFKKELGISNKYIEKQEGVLGLSWAHFLTMVFLICSFVLGLIFVVIRYRRTKELLTIMSEEEGKHGSNS